ncbi:MAG: molybdopterin molybdenumtransferase MoeA, partial [Proteobacteria bacterium]|nr:molybdopterin molybdenumtransferase MoeA [Pseudomonadota bacterium]
ASAEADLIVSSGGVSAGEADFLPNLLTEIGRIHFWKARIKPGMPLLCANIDRALMFGLPGNPASGVATFLAFVRPALDAMTRRLPRKPLWARLARRIDKTHERVEFLRARLLCDETGTLLATPLPKQGSGQLRGVAESDVLIVLPEAEGEYPAGTVVEAVPLSDWA